jgi:hypothetical protein
MNESNLESFEDMIQASQSKLASVEVDLGGISIIIHLSRQNQVGSGLNLGFGLVMPDTAKSPPRCAV